MAERRDEINWPLLIGGLTALGIVAWGLTVGAGSETNPQKPFTNPSFKKGGTPAGGATGIKFLGDPMSLEQGKKYRARLELSGLERLASREQLASAFAAQGFEGVNAFLSARELPGDWPVITSQAPTENTRWVEGVFARDSTRVARSEVPAIRQVWEA